MLSRNLRLLLRISATSALYDSFLQKRMSTLSGPPARRISLFTRMLHLGVFSSALLVGPVMFFSNLKKIKGITAEEKAETEEDEQAEQEEVT